MVKNNSLATVHKTHGDGKTAGNRSGVPNFALTVTSSAPRLIEGFALAESKIMERCRELKEQKQRLAEDIKSQDAVLLELVSKMNSVTGAKKLDLLAALLTYMVQQRIVLDARRAKLERETMKHSLQHMQLAKESLSQCPLMKGMKSRLYYEANA
jgi:hypothetical protein